MEILLARDMGFCWGVRRAIDIIEKAAHEKDEIVTLGPIVHNPQVVRELAEHGARQVNSLPDNGASPVAISAHGAGPDVIQKARLRGTDVIDTTCPIVTRSQRWAKKMADAGFTVVIFGDPDHREVKGVLAWSGQNSIALREDDPIPQNLPSRLAVMSQTTQTPDRFADFLSRLIREQLGRITELRVVNTLCDVTSSQQAAARELARDVDVMFVVGGRSSANTRHLLEVCEDEGTMAHHVESPAELKMEWLIDCNRVGVTAGASTPDSAVEAVIREVQRVTGEPEGVTSPH